VQRDPVDETMDVVIDSDQESDFKELIFQDDVREFRERRKSNLFPTYSVGRFATY
jgi:hypothetical protein